MENVVHESPKGIVTHEANGDLHIVAAYRRAYDGKIMRRPMTQSVVSQYSLHDVETEIRDHIWQLEHA